MNALQWLYNTESTSQMSATTHDYITKQIQRYHAAGSSEQKDDCLWRIASAADLLPPDVQSITDENRQFVTDWISGFETTLASDSVQSLNIEAEIH
jgi:hypothetical protein